MDHRSGRDPLHFKESSHVHSTAAAKTLPGRSWCIEASLKRRTRRRAGACIAGKSRAGSRRGRTGAIECSSAEGRLGAGFLEPVRTKSYPESTIVGLRARCLLRGTEEETAREPRDSPV